MEHEESDREYELLYDADGFLLQKEEEIDSKALPDPVIQAVTSAYPKGKVKEAEKIMNPMARSPGMRSSSKRMARNSNSNWTSVAKS